MRFSIVAAGLLVFGFISFSKCATWRGQGSDPKHPGQCVINGKEFIDFGQEYHPKDRCEKISCLADGYMIGLTCGVKSVDNCNDTGYVDISKPYPDCCLKKFVCREGGEDKVYEL